MEMTKTTYKILACKLEGKKTFKDIDAEGRITLIWILIMVMK
jgi:hypothetical protein